MDARPGQEIEVRLIAGQGDDIVIRDGPGPIGCLDIHLLWPYGRQLRMCIGFDTTLLDTVLYIRLYPIFYAPADPFAPDDHGHFGAFTPGLQGRVHGGVAGAYDHYFLHSVEV